MYKTYEECCKKAGVSTYQVCKDTGLSQATICDWKAGRYTPKVDKLMILANYFKIPLEDFIKKEGQK